MKWMTDAPGANYGSIKDCCCTVTRLLPTASIDVMQMNYLPIGPQTEK